MQILRGRGKICNSHGEYIIEIEDGRRGQGTIGINSYSSFELVIDSFNMKGTGPLKHAE